MSTINSSGDSYLSEVTQMAGDSASFMTFIDIDDDGKLDFILQKDTDGVHPPAEAAHLPQLLLYFL